MSEREKGLEVISIVNNRLLSMNSLVLISTKDLEINVDKCP